MIIFIFSCGRCFISKALGSKKAASFLQRNLSNEKIHIPQRKSRGPLDILQALAHTIKPEKGVPEYRFQYGVAFNLSSDYYRRALAMSMDSGRKAAKWIVAQYPTLFEHKSAEPYIKAFAPPKKISEDTPVSEEILLSAINDVQVEDAIKLYKLMKEKNIDVSSETEQQLLELVCYFNGKNKPDITLIETKHFENPPGTSVNTWEKDGFAEELFLKMEPNSKSYSALILGRFKFNNVSKAFDLYEEAKEKGIDVDLDVYNALLEHATSKAFDHAEQKAYIIEILKEMNDKNIQPNLGTLNGVLKSVDAMKKWVKAKSLALEVYEEFKEIGIEPSLATYYYLLSIFNDRKRVTIAFTEILKETENKAFDVRHPDDLKFFNIAMEIATFNFRSIKLAHKVHGLLMTGNNKYFLNGSFNLTRYYRNYISAAFRYDDLDAAVNLLEGFVPQAYVPEIVGILIILTSLKTRNGAEFLPRIWPHIEDATLKSEKALSNVIELLNDGLAFCKNDNFMEIAVKLWQACKNESSIIRNPANVTTFLKLFTLAENKILSDEVFTKVLTFVNQLELDFESLNLYHSLCISNKDKKMALAALEHMKALGYDRIDILAKRTKSVFHLEKDEETFIDHLLKGKMKTKEGERKNSPV